MKERVAAAVRGEVLTAAVFGKIHFGALKILGPHSKLISCTLILKERKQIPRNETKEKDCCQC